MWHPNKSTSASVVRFRWTQCYCNWNVIIMFPLIYSAVTHCFERKNVICVWHDVTRRRCHDIQKSEKNQHKIDNRGKITTAQNCHSCDCECAIACTCKPLIDAANCSELWVESERGHRLKLHAGSDVAEASVLRLNGIFIVIIRGGIIK